MVTNLVMVTLVEATVTSPEIRAQQAGVPQAGVATPKAIVSNRDLRRWTHGPQPRSVLVLGGTR